MQQTRLDRWLKEKFVQETHVYCVSPPPWVPPGVEVEAMEITMRNRFQYRMRIRNRAYLVRTLQALSDASQTFTTKVVARDVWCRKFFDHPGGASFTFRVIWLCVGILLVLTVLVLVPWHKLGKLSEAFGFLKQYM